VARVWFVVVGCADSALSRSNGAGGGAGYFGRAGACAVCGRYHIKVHPPLTLSGENPEADALLVNQFLEEQLLHNPEQYLWVHRRFKTRPEGEPDIYNIDHLLERSLKRRARRVVKRSNKG
jgi:Lauroyl/myristoyl acyltransferase